MTSRTARIFAGAVVLAAVASPAAAWDAFGHRLIARLALESAAAKLGERAPEWLKEKDRAEMIADQAVVPDRWRSARVAALKHLNDPDHYLDLEELADYGLELSSIPELRHEYVRRLTLAREKPGFKGPPVNERTDPEHVREYPGFLPQATMETWGKVVSSFRTVRTLEQLNDPSRRLQLEMARASAAYNMGVLAHYVGDAAQPLHTTIHHHGWVGENPNGYTTDRGIHAYIDGGVIRLQHITDEDVRPLLPADRAADSRNPWEDVLANIRRSHEQLVPLYELKKAGGLEKEEGKKFIASRLADGAATLGALYVAAWEASAVGEKDVQEFVRYDGPREGR